MGRNPDRFACGVCRKRLYTERGSLNRHMRDHHAGESFDCLQFPPAAFAAANANITQHGQLQDPLPQALASQVTLIPVATAAAVAVAVAVAAAAVADPAADPANLIVDATLPSQTALDPALVPGFALDPALAPGSSLGFTPVFDPNIDPQLGTHPHLDPRLNPHLGVGLYLGVGPHLGVGPYLGFGPHFGVGPHLGVGPYLGVGPHLGPDTRPGPGPCPGPDPHLDPDPDPDPDFHLDSHLNPRPRPRLGPGPPSPISYLRSSRSMRNQEHQVASRSRGPVDLDPTEGLPVQKWERVSVRINQDPSADPSASTNPSTARTTSSAEWEAQFNTPQHPWPELPLPSFYDQLAPWNQAYLRRSRAGDLNSRASVWDYRKGNWMSAAEAEARQNPLKSVHLNNLDHTSTNNNISDDTAQHDEDEDNDDAEDDGMPDDNEEEGPIRGTLDHRRRQHTVPEDRAFVVKRWQQVPLDVAEKIEERKFLADRRPGMPSLYGGAYQAQVFGTMGLTQNGYSGNGTSSASYDVIDGSGLSTAIGANGNDQGTATPVRRNMPPKRKKKKGGPGRRKAPQTATDGAGSSVQANTGVLGQDQEDMTQTDGGDGGNDGKENEDVTMQDGDGDGDGSGSDDSEGEGSEEGEIDEGRIDEGTQAPVQEQLVTASVAEDVPISESVPASVPEILVASHVAEPIVIEPTVETDVPATSPGPAPAPVQAPVPVPVPESAPAATPPIPTVDANDSEIDLLGGLEDQLDRDMQE